MDSRAQIGAYFDAISPDAGYAETGRYGFFPSIFGDPTGKSVSLDFDCNNDVKTVVNGTGSLACATGDDRFSEFGFSGTSACADRSVS